MDELALAILDPDNAAPEMRALRDQLLAQVKSGLATQGRSEPSLSPSEDPAPEPEPEVEPLRVGPPLADDDKIVFHLHTLRAPDVAWEDRHRNGVSAPVGLPPSHGDRRAARFSRPRAS